MQNFSAKFKFLRTLNLQNLMINILMGTYSALTHLKTLNGLSTTFRNILAEKSDQQEWFVRWIFRTRTIFTITSTAYQTLCLLPKCRTAKSSWLTQNQLSVNRWATSITDLALCWVWGTGKSSLSKERKPTNWTWQIPDRSHGMSSTLFGGTLTWDSGWPALSSTRITPLRTAVSRKEETVKKLRYRICSWWETGRHKWLTTNSMKSSSNLYNE